VFRLTISDQLWGWTEREFFERFAAYLVKTGRPTTLTVERTCPVRSFFHLPGRYRKWGALGFLQEEATGTFCAMNCDDWVDGELGMMRILASDPRCRVILKQQYQHALYSTHPLTKVKPWTYLSCFPSEVDVRADDLRTIPRWRAPMYFRGKVTHRRRAAILRRLVDLGVVAPETDAVPFEPYLRELSQYRLALSLPGWGNLCHREIEAFAVGTPVLMPRLLNELHDPLGPDQHYVSVNVAVDGTDPNGVAQAIAERYWEVIDDHAFLERVVRNATQWYDTNARFPAVLALTDRLLNFPSRG
jgi:hypothetical protein